MYINLLKKEGKSSLDMIIKLDMTKLKAHLHIHLKSVSVPDRNKTGKNVKDPIQWNSHGR